MLWDNLSTKNCAKIVLWSTVNWAPELYTVISTYIWAVLTGLFRFRFSEVFFGCFSYLGPVCVYFIFLVYFLLSLPVQVIARKNSSPKRPITCDCWVSLALRHIVCLCLQCGVEKRCPSLWTWTPIRTSLNCCYSWRRYRWRWIYASMISSTSSSVNTMPIDDFLHWR